MDRISLAEFQKLLVHTHPYSISLYLSTDEMGLDTSKREAQYRFLMEEASAELKNMDVSPGDLKLLTQKMADVLNTDLFWEHGPLQLAVFISPDVQKIFRLPITVSDLSLISYRFHLKPLIRLMTQPSEFYLLTLAEKGVSLFRGDLYGMEKVPVPDLPQSIEEVTGQETGERHLQFHTSTKSPNGSIRPAMYHGSSSWKDDKHKYLARYVQAIHSAVEKQLRDHTEPLILSGVERMVTTYTEMNSYPHFTPQLVLKGNHEHTALTELHKQALALLEPYFIEQEKAVIEKYFAHGDSAKFSTDLDEILRQVTLGRVDKLLVAQGVREWGQFNPTTLDITHTIEPTPDTHDLLDLACVQTLLNGGKAYVLPPEQIPDHQHVAAVFRY